MQSTFRASQFKIALSLLILAAWMSLHTVSAHPGFPASALLKVDADGHVIVHVRHDALAFVLNETPANIGDEPMRKLLDAPRANLQKALDEGHARFDSLFVLTADGRRLAIDITGSPTIEQIEAAKRQSNPVRLPLMLDFVAEAQLPASVSAFAVLFPEIMGDVIMTIERPGREPFSIPLRAGEQSPDFDLKHVDDASVPATSNPQSAIPHSESFTALEVAWRYVWLGITHIIPHGADHMLFVLGLFFLSPKIKPLLWQVTAFTIAHCITLTLATMNIIRVPPDIVEPIIAASIAFIAIENLFTTTIHPWRPAIVFCFGLIHGMGFAGVLKEVGLPSNQLTAALISFNIGVELGQLSVIALAFLAVGWWRNKKWYRPRISIPASAAIACVGVYWTVQRVMGW
jgi:hypothetical protein